jgi:hypothetical protein
MSERTGGHASTGMVSSESAPCGQTATQCPQVKHLPSAPSTGLGVNDPPFNSMAEAGHSATQMPSRVHRSASILMGLTATSNKTRYTHWR